MIDAIDVVGSAALVSDTMAAYRRAGVQVPVIFPLTWGAARNDEPAALDATLRAAASHACAARGGLCRTLMLVPAVRNGAGRPLRRRMRATPDWAASDSAGRATSATSGKTAGRGRPEVLADLFID